MPEDNKDSELDILLGNSTYILDVDIEDESAEPNKRYLANTLQNDIFSYRNANNLCWHLPLHLTFEDFKNIFMDNIIDEGSRAALISFLSDKDITKDYKAMCYQIRLTQEEIKRVHSEKRRLEESAQDIKLKMAKCLDSYNINEIIQNTEEHVDQLKNTSTKIGDCNIELRRLRLSMDFSSSENYDIGPCPRSRNKFNAKYLGNID